jgi:GT2 family glycosyltransferase
MDANCAPELSIVVVSYNSEKTIYACIESLESQRTEKRFEVILVDSSSDRTDIMVKTFFPFVKVFKFIERKYAGDARNIGVSCSTAPVIAFMDSDCTVQENWVDEILKAHKGEYDVVGGVIENGEPKTLTSWAYYFCEFNLWLPSDSEKEIPEVAGCSLSMKRRIFDKYGPFLEGTYCSDTAFHWKMWKDGLKVLLVPSIRVFHSANHSAWSLINHVFSHRYQYAKLMVNEKKISVFQRISLAVLSPFLPPVFFFMALLRVLKSGVFLKEFFLSSPLIFVGMTVRAWGEWMGLIEKQ